MQECDISGRTLLLLGLRQPRVDGGISGPDGPGSFDKGVSVRRRFRFLVSLLTALLVLPAGTAGAVPNPLSPPAMAERCAAGDVLHAAVELFGSGTEFAQMDHVGELTTALVLEPLIAPGTRHRLIAIPGGWCDAELAFNHAWRANGLSPLDGDGMAEAYARLAAAPYFDQTTVTSRTSVAGVHTIKTHSLTNGVEARWTIVTDPAGVRTARWVSTGFAVKPFVAQWEGLTGLEGLSESYARVADGRLDAVRGLPTGAIEEPSAEVSFVGEDGFKIVVGYGDARVGPDPGQDAGNFNVDYLRAARDVAAENYQDFYDWGFRGTWAPTRHRVYAGVGGLNVNAAPTFGPPGTGYIMFNSQSGLGCLACVWIADDFQIHMNTEFDSAFLALGYSYPGASRKEVLADVLGHEMFHNWQNNYVKPTSTGRSVPGSYSEGTARMQEALHSYSHISHQPNSLIYAADLNGCNGFSASDAGMAGGAFQTAVYEACNFWLPWYGAEGIDVLSKLVREGAPAGAAVPGASNARKVIGAIEVATGQPYAVSAAEWAAGLITGEQMVWGPATGTGETLDWAEHLRRWKPAQLLSGQSATRNLAEGGVMARRVYASSLTATITEGATLAVLRDTIDGLSITLPTPGEEIDGPAAGEEVYLLGINPGTTSLTTTIGIQATGPEPPSPEAVQTTMYMDGAAPIGEGDALGFQTLVPQASGEEKSKQILNYVGGPNNNCAGNNLFPVFVGSLSGTVTGDLAVKFDARSTPGEVLIRVWPDVNGQFCNATYIQPARSAQAALPSGEGVVEVAIPGDPFDVGSYIMVQVSPAPVTISEDPPVNGLSPFVARMFYGTTASRVEFSCVPYIGETDCIPGGAGPSTFE